MAVASERLAAPAIPAPSSRWRGLPMRLAGVLLVMTLAFALWRGEFPWPSWLTWSELPERLDSLQTWLLEQRTAEDPNIVFALLDAFRAFGDWLVTALIDALAWLTWVGTAAAGVLIVWRWGGWRAALIVLAAFVSFALMGLWEEVEQTLALMLAAVAALAPDRRAARRPGRTLAARAQRAHPDPRRDADRARVRLPDAGRDPLLGRAGRGGHLHDDLRDPARRPHHRARHPRRQARHGGGGAGVRRDAVPDALEGAAAAGAQGAPAAASTRRSCSPSRSP